MKIDKRKVDLVMAKQGITPKMVAARLNTTPPALALLWSGRRDSQVKTVHKLADALRVKVEDIII